MTTHAVSSSEPAQPGDLLARHTLVIPTYNRAALLKRLVTYYAARQPMPILVLDSSAPEIAAENAAALAPYEVFVRRVVFPTTMPPAVKLAQGLAHVETATVSFCADDDLVFPDGLREALAFLAGHPDHVSAHGLYLNFGEHGHNIHVMREYAGPSNDAEHPGARIFRLCQNYESLYYGVFRTADLRDIFTAMDGLDSLHYQELFQSVAALIKGKVKRFPSFYAGRRSGPAAEPDRGKWQTYYWFADDAADFMDHFREYRERVFAFYQAHAPSPQLDRAAFLRAVDMAHAIYFSKGCPPAYFHSVLQPYWPDDAFIERRDDLFQLMRQGSSGRALAAGQRAVITALRRMGRWHRRMFRDRTASTAEALAGLNREIEASCRAPWRCELAPELGWLAANETFRATYRELCSYLDMQALEYDPEKRS